MTPAAALRVALVLGCALRLARPTVHSFWFDEGATLLAAQAADFLGFMRQDSHPPLSFLAFRGWMALCGESDLALRLLPALASCAALLLFAPLARAWLGAERAPWAVALLAVAPLAVWFAHEVRMYAFVEVATLLVLHAARAAWRAPRVSTWAALAAAVALATGFHYYGCMAGLAAIAQAIARTLRGQLAGRAAAATAAACALGVAVWTPWLTTILPAQYANDWPRIARFAFQDLAEVPVRLVGVDLSVLVEHGLELAGWILGGLCLLGVAAWSLRLARRRDTGELECLLAALVPVAAPIALAVLARGGFQPRYLVPAMPGTIAAIAAGLLALRPAWIARAAAGVLLALALATTLLQLSGNRREDYRAACAEIAERWQDGDRLLVLVCVPRAYPMATVEHYLRDRPEILASALAPEPYLAGTARPPSGTRVHVLWREATLCWEPWDRLRRTHAFEEQAPVRFRIHRALVRAP